MVETKHNAANRLRLYLLLSKNTKNKEGFASTMTESLNSLIRLCKLMGKMPKRQIFLQRLLKINLHRCSSYLELWAMRFYLKTSTPPPPNWVTSSINFTGVKVFSFFHEKCASVITEKKWQTAKAKDSLEKKKGKHGLCVTLATGATHIMRSSKLGMTRMTLPEALLGSSICKWAYCI